ncbi:MarC family protein [Oceanicella sp. SM1341]|uniref:MarC family protein n=1 Tax=Oceanicella sp. SM1341 TaxID=1548889 RepID=UPI000E4B6FDD|nr:MarC family protein [Oceanicella sp. SM1341]
MDFSTIDLKLVATLLLLLLVGLGPKIALVPFLEKTRGATPEQQRAVGRLMVRTAVASAVVVFLAGALLLRLLHITSGAVAVAGGIILALIAMRMALGPGEEVVKESHLVPEKLEKMAIYPLAVPYLFNPVGMTILIIASDSAESWAASALVLGLVLLVGALDYVIFSNIDKIAKRINPTSLVVSEIVFGILLTAVAVQLFVTGLRMLEILPQASGGH